MENEYVKKLISKNQKDFDFAASHIINECDVEAFSALVEKDDFLFDFVKENVRKRLQKQINKSNFENLFEFLKVYSAEYEELFVSNFVKFANEDITDKMLEILENGTVEEKTYAAKYFSYVNDSLCLDSIKNLYKSDFEPLAYNCAEVLGIMKDKESLDEALENLNSIDEFVVLDAVKFLIAYKAENILDKIFEAMKFSAISENIAAEIPYITSFVDLLHTKHRNDALLAINFIINAFGDIIPLAQVFDFEFFDVFSNLSREHNSKNAITLLNARQKFAQLTENDEYLFDESKDTKQEINDINNAFNSLTDTFWEEQIVLIEPELDEKSDFVLLALEQIQQLNLTQYFPQLQNLLSAKNETIILKVVEVIKSLGKLDSINKDFIEKISNENIKEIINAMF